MVAGLKLNQMIEDGTVKEDACKIGYVGAYPYAEVISGYTSFYLRCDVLYARPLQWKLNIPTAGQALTLKKSAADALISDGCVLISQHADTTGAPTACEAAGVPCVGYNISMTSATAPEHRHLPPHATDWGVYYDLRCTVHVLDGTADPILTGARASLKAQF